MYKQLIRRHREFNLDGITTLALNITSISSSLNSPNSPNSPNNPKNSSEGSENERKGLYGLYDDKVMEVITARFNTIIKPNNPSNPSKPSSPDSLNSPGRQGVILAQYALLLDLLDTMV